MPIYWNLPLIAELMERRGIENRKRLSEVANLSMPTAYALFDRESLRRIDVPTLLELARVLKPATIWDLLDYTPDD
jgi:hypothetical protein